jgi:hypothetical protein
LDVYLSVLFTGMDIDKINKCVGDPDADEDNPVLKAEQDAQVRLLVNSQSID